MKKFLNSICVLTVLFFSFSTTAANRIAILDVVFEWTWTDEVELQFTEAIETGFRQDPTTFNVLSNDEVKSILESAAPEVIGCYDPQCLSVVGDALAADVGVKVTVVGDGDSYSYSFQFYILSTAELVLESEKECMFCRKEEAKQILMNSSMETLETLKPKLETLPVVEKESIKPMLVVLIVNVDPPETHVVINTEPAGQGNISVELQPGEYVINLSAEGYRGLEQTVLVSEETRGPIFVVAHLSQTSQISTVNQANNGLIDNADRSLYGWIFLGSGLLSLATGSALLALDGEPTCGGHISDCPEVYNTFWGGMIATVLGTAALTTSIFMFFWDDFAGEKDSPSEGVGVGFYGDSLGVSFSGSF